MYFKIWESTEPHMYNSKEVGKLKPEDLAFPFKTRFLLPGEHFIGTTMTCHNEMPKLSCSHCLMPGHSNAVCPVHNLAYWKKLEKNIPKVRDNKHFRELSECFLQLLQFHELPPDTVERQVSFNCLKLWLYSLTNSHWQCGYSKLNILSRPLPHTLVSEDEAQVSEWSFILNLAPIIQGELSELRAG